MADAEIVNLDAVRAQCARGISFGWHSLGLDGDARDHASRLARLGLHPIALHGINEHGECTCGDKHEDHDGRRKARGKHPLQPKWQSLKLDNGYLEAVLLRDWHFNLGLRLGEQPNGWRLIALDVDGDESLLEPLVAKWGPLPKTLTARTGSGGLHYIFRMPEGAAMPPNSASKMAPHVDVRSAGGQVVVAPSKHYSGNRYRWTRCIEPAVLP